MQGICRVLIVDDCEEDRTVYRRYLQRTRQDIETNAYFVRETESAEDALRLCETEQFDVVLLDYELPELSGLEFLAWSQTQRLTNVAIIMLSAFGSEALAVQALKQGAQDYLVKQSLTAEVLTNAIRSSLEQVRLKQQLQQSQQRQQLISNIALRIRASLDLAQILETTVVEIRNLLHCDRVLVLQCNASNVPQILAESVAAGVPSVGEFDCEAAMSLACSIAPFEVQTVDPDPLVCSDIGQGDLDASDLQLLQALGVKSLLQVPILLDSNVGQSRRWGTLVLHQGAIARSWKPVELEILQELCVHLAIAIQQSELLTQTQCALVKEQELNQFKSKIVATVSHEYRTPITSILASASTLERHFDKLNTAQNQRLLHLIAQQARHLRELVDDMLVVNQTELGQIQFKPFPLNLKQFFERLVDEYQVMILPKHELILKWEGDYDNFQGDLGLCKQIFSNLLSNAIKYSPQGGPIILSIEGTDDNIIVRIRDSGIGIPAADLPLICQSFTRGSNVDTITGTGLGLSIAKACVALHKGQLEMRSQLNQYTEAVVKLPKHSVADLG